MGIIHVFSNCRNTAKSSKASRIFIINSFVLNTNTKQKLVDCFCANITKRIQVKNFHSIWDSLKNIIIKVSLPNFTPKFVFHTPWKRQKIRVFLTFLGTFFTQWLVVFLINILTLRFDYLNVVYWIKFYNKLFSIRDHKKVPWYPANA